RESLLENWIVSVKPVSTPTPLGLYAVTVRLCVPAVTVDGIPVSSILGALMKLISELYFGVRFDGCPMYSIVPHSPKGLMPCTLLKYASMSTPALLRRFKYNMFTPNIPESRCAAM